MRYVSLDLETTSLHPGNGQILEIGAVVDDLSNPLPLDQLSVYHKYVTNKDMIIIGELQSIAMNGGIFKSIVDNLGTDLVIDENELSVDFENWLVHQKISKVTFGGKNFGMFDSKFLDRLPGWDDVNYSHRALDVGSMYVTKEDEQIPNLSQCLERANLPSKVLHTAVEDAMQVIQLVRHKLL